MQQRSWAMIVQLDLITSSQIRLPRMMKDWQSDTAEPRNLLDGDFDVNVTEQFLVSVWHDLRPDNINKTITT